MCKTKDNLEDCRITVPLFQMDSSVAGGSGRPGLGDLLRKKYLEKAEEGEIRVPCCCSCSCSLDPIVVNGLWRVVEVLLPDTIG